MLGSILPASGLTGLNSWQFLLLLFAINCLGELGIPFPLVLAGVMVFAGYHFAEGALASGASMLGAGILGSMAGALALYLLARRSGGLSRLRVPKWLPLDRLYGMSEGAGSDRLSVSGIAHARLVPGLALPVTAAAGLTHIPWSRLLAGVVLSELLWVTPLVAIGFAMGMTALDLDGVAQRVPFLVALAAGLLLAARVARYLWRRRRDRVTARPDGADAVVPREGASGPAPTAPAPPAL